MALPPCPHVLIERQASRHPYAPAVLSADNVITYRKLNADANRIAHYLQQRVLKAGLPRRVGLYLSSSYTAVVAVLGVLKAGATAVPLDASYPEERLRMILQTVGLSAVLSSSREDGVSGKWPIPCLPADLLLDDIALPATNLTVPTTLRSTAFILYTSGTSGEPKGVLRPQRAIVHRLRWTRFSPDDVFCHNMSLAVGFSQERLLLPLMVGRRLAVASDHVALNIGQFVDFLVSSRVTQLTLVPALLDALLNAPATRLTKLVLRSVAVGGSELRPALVRDFEDILPDTTLINTYGSTETGTVIRGRAQIRSLDGPVPIGYPLPDVTAHVLDGDRQLVPSGVVGELYVSGPPLAEGYLTDDTLTAGRFISDPYSEIPSRLCRTGDRARVRDDGQIELLGRVDRQVKVRGYRVEPDEVERALLKTNVVSDAAVVPVLTGSGTRLVAFAVIDNAAPVSHKELRSRLRSLLPEYMVPTTFVVTDKLPRTPSLKVDYSRLPDPRCARPDLSSVYRAPTSLVEEQLQGFWEELLDIDRIGIDDVFFELGGDSLHALQLLHVLSDVFDVEFSLDSLLTTPLTIAGLASAIQPAVGSSPASVARLPGISDYSYGTRPPASFGQELGIFSELGADGRGRAERNGVSNTGFAFVLDGALDLAALDAALASILERHEVLRTAFEVRTQLWRSLCISLRTRRLQRIMAIRTRAAPSSTIRCRYIDLLDQAPDVIARSLQELGDPLLRARYDYRSPPFLRVAVVRIRSRRHILLLGVSHLVFDGLSRDIFQYELGALYDHHLTSLPHSLPSLSCQFGNYAAWQRTTFTPSRLDAVARYWLDRYREFPPLTVAALSALDGSFRSTGPPVTEETTLESDLRRQIRSSAARMHTTLYAFLLAVLFIVLRRYSRSDRMSIGTYYSNRTALGTDSLIGDFANNYMVGVRVSTGLSFSSLAASIVRFATDAQGYQHIPRAVINHYLFGRSSSHPALRLPTHEVEFALVTDRQVHRSSLLRIAPSIFPHLTAADNITAHRLAIRCVDDGHRLRLQMTYVPSQISPARIEHLFSCLQSVSSAVLSQSEDLQGRMRRKARKIRTQLGVSADLTDPVWKKPKGMHWKTFSRLALRERAANEAAVQAWTVGAVAFLNKRGWAP